MKGIALAFFNAVDIINGRMKWSIKSNTVEVTTVGMSYQMNVRACSHGNMMLDCVAVCQSVLIGGIAGIGYFKGITLKGMQIHSGKIISLSERMSLHYQTTVFVNLFQMGNVIPGHYFRMSKQPCLVQTVYQKFITIKAAFPSKENGKALLISFCFGSFIGETVTVDPFLPGKGIRNTGIAVKEVVCDKDAAVAKLLIIGNIFFRLAASTGAGNT
jgi:hypothetical protein